MKEQQIKRLTIGQKYNLKTMKGEFLVGELGISSKEDGIYFFSGDFGIYDMNLIAMATPYVEFDYVKVGGGFALTKNGKKVFSDNIYGIIYDEGLAKEYARIMSINANNNRGEDLRKNTLVKIIFGKLIGKEALITNISKPLKLSDLGSVEVFLLAEKRFETFDYTDWNKFFKIIN